MKDMIIEAPIGTVQKVGTVARRNGNMNQIVDVLYAFPDSRDFLEELEWNLDEQAALINAENLKHRTRTWRLTIREAIVRYSTYNQPEDIPVTDAEGNKLSIAAVVPGSKVRMTYRLRLNRNVSKDTLFISTTIESIIVETTP